MRDLHLGKKPPVFSPDEVQTIQQKVLEVVEPLLPERFYLVDVSLEREAGLWYLRLYVDAADGTVSLNDCEALSRQLDPAIDELKELKEQPFNFEISSPGVFRTLKTPREFAYYQGRAIRIETQAAEKTQPTMVVQEGVLAGYEADTRTVYVKKSEAAEETTALPLSDNMTVMLNPPLKMPE
jgi:ribosome maturation factor RimP